MKHFVVAFGDVTYVAVFAKDEQEARQRMAEAASVRWDRTTDPAAWERLAEEATVYELGEEPVWF